MADRRFKPKKKKPWARPYIGLLCLLVVLLAAAVVAFWPPNERIKQGLDIKGGLSVVMQASKPDGSAVSADDLEVATLVVERRVNMLGASEASVQKQGDNQLLIQIPGVVDQTQALETIGQTGYLEFVNVADVSDEAQRTALEAGQTWIQAAIPDEEAVDSGTETDSGSEADSGSETGSGSETDSGTENETLSIQPIILSPGTYSSIFTGADISSVNVGKESETSPNYSVNLVLNASATKAFAEVTTALYPTNGRIAIVLDGLVQSAPAVQNAITNGNVAITGGYDLDSANALKTVLQSGSLPVTLTVATSQVVGPTLGQDSLRAGILVAIIGLIVVALYLLVFYRGLGLLTAGSIGIFALLYLGILALLSILGLFALSLAGIAGIVLAIGVAADSSILILERFKEEIRMGRSVRAASMTGVKHAITTSIDADLVTLVSALALFFIAVGSVKGFGLTLAIGVLCDIVTMLLFKAPLIRLMAPKIITRHPGFWGIGEDEAVAHAWVSEARVENG